MNLVSDWLLLIIFLPKNGKNVFDTLYGSKLILKINWSIFKLKNNFFHSFLFLSLLINHIFGSSNNSLYLFMQIFNKDSKYNDGIRRFEKYILLLYNILLW